MARDAKVEQRRWRLFERHWRAVSADPWRRALDPTPADDAVSETSLVARLLSKGATGWSAAVAAPSSPDRPCAGRSFDEARRTVLLVGIPAADVSSTSAP